MSKRAWLTGAFSALACATACQALASETNGKPPATAADRFVLTPNPAIRSGVLPNGLRYLILRNVTPKHAVSLRLGLRVGSFEEGDAEQGFAHFIEHMAFRAPHSFGENGAERVFTPWGVAFGQDHNAKTEIQATTYQLDLPEPDETQLNRGFAWLRDAADRIDFSDDAVAKERGVVLAEMEARHSTEKDVAETIVRFQLQGQRSATRMPIGLRKTIEGVSAASLKAFHQRWYRPELATVVVVGDLPTDQVEADLKAAFSTWKAIGPAPTRAPLSPPRADRGADAIVVEGDKTMSAISACTVGPLPPQEPDSLARRQDAIRSVAWQGILNRRLARLADEPQNGLFHAETTSTDLRESRLTCLIVIPTKGNWSIALRAAQEELIRLDQDGPTDLEVETQVEKQRSTLRGRASSATAQASSVLADELVAISLEDRVNDSPADALYAFDLAVEDITPQAVKKRLAADWRQGAPLLAATGSEAPSREALLAAWSQNQKEASKAKYVDQTKPVWPYESFGKAGKVVERRVVADPGFVRLRFANGLILNFKQRSAEPSRIQIGLTFGDGRRSIADRDAPALDLGAATLGAGGFGKISAQDLKALFASASVPDCDIDVGVQHFTIHTVTFTNNFTDQLNVLAACMSDPGFRPSLETQLPLMIDYVYRTTPAAPAQMLSLEMTTRLAPTAQTARQPRETLEKLTAADFARVLRPILTTSPIELNIVGDVDEATVVKLVASTFGAMPPRADHAPPASVATFVRYPATSPPILVEHQGPSDQAAARLIWPLYVMTPERRREEFALMLLGKVFDTALRHRIREELGQTYAPKVVSRGLDQGDQGALTVTIETTPDYVDALTDEARATAARLARGEISSQMLEDARQPWLAAARAQRESNDWWLAAISSQDPAQRAELLGYEQLIGTITVDEVRAAAARWLTQPPIVGVARPPRLAAQQSQGAAQ